MDVFPMCEECKREYENIEDRRYHAQPNACPRCGPHYTLRLAGGEHIGEFDEILDKTTALIEAGGIVAIKGIGGFHLACNAADENAVRRLRENKRRDGKPFAVMYRSAEKLVGLVVSEEEYRLLHDPGRPIVLLRREKSGLDGGTERGANRKPRQTAASVTQGLHTLGVMLPYAPIHHLLFSRLRTDALVMTSGNPSEEPLIHRNDEAEKRLAGTADAFLHYNREIHNRCDDSVAMIAAGQVRTIRRSRGMVPNPVALPFSADGVVAGGAELKSCFAVGKGESVFLSQHIGDLKNYETLLFYRETLERFLELFRITPRSAVCDLHPDYASTREMQALGLPLTEVQHHHAHIASVLVEQGIEETVIGVGFDGTGYGDDGAAWGGEFFLCDMCGYERVSQLSYVPMPGGDRAVEEPWRMALSHLRQAYPEDRALRLASELCGIDSDRLELISRAISTGTAAPATSSAGRLFDAVSSLLGITQVSSFEAEASMRLEALAWRCADDRIQTHEKKDAGARGGEEEILDIPVYSFLSKNSQGKGVETAGLIREIVEDIDRGAAREEIALKFHRSVAEIVVSVAGWARDLRGMRESGGTRASAGIDTVVLSGGVFQNRLLLEMAFKLLEIEGFRVYANREVPANDGGIALGQIAVAGARDKKNEKRGGVYVSGYSG